jgi:hypothetical protein
MPFQGFNHHSSTEISRNSPKKKLRGENVHSWCARHSMDQRRATAFQASIDNGTLLDKVAAAAMKESKRWKGAAKPRTVRAPPAVVLGLDFGKVICGARTDSEGDCSAFFGDRYLDAPQVPGACEGVSQLVSQLGNSKVFVVSKVRAQGRQRTREWLEHNKFYAATGLRAHHVFFCNSREEKAPICAALGITAFVDDAADVLAAMPAVPLRLLLLPPVVLPAKGAAGAAGAAGAGGGTDGGVVVARSWREVCAHILPGLVLVPAAATATGSALCTRQCTRVQAAAAKPDAEL